MAGSLRDSLKAGKYPVDLVEVVKLLSIRAVLVDSEINWSSEAMKLALRKFV